MKLSRLPYLVLLWLVLMAVPTQAQQRRMIPPEEREEMSAERELSSVKGALRAGFVAGPVALVLYFMGVDATLIAFWAFISFLGASFHPFAGLLAAAFGIWTQKSGNENEPSTERGADMSSDDEDELDDLPF